MTTPGAAESVNAGRLLVVNTSAVLFVATALPIRPSPSLATKHRQPWTLSPGSAVPLLLVERHYAERLSTKPRRPCAFPFDILTRAVP